MCCWNHSPINSLQPCAVTWLTDKHNTRWLTLLFSTFKPFTANRTCFFAVCFMKSCSAHKKFELKHSCFLLHGSYVTASFNLILVISTLCSILPHHVLEGTCTGLGGSSSGTQWVRRGLMRNG